MRNIRYLHPNLDEGLARDSVVGICCTDVRGLPKSAERGRNTPRLLCQDLRYCLEAIGLEGCLDNALISDSELDLSRAD